MRGATRPSMYMASMSTSDWRISRYTMPRKLSGSDSWKTSPLIITRSPTVIVPRICWQVHASVRGCVCVCVREKTRATAFYITRMLTCTAAKAARCTPSCSLGRYLAHFPLVSHSMRRPVCAHMRACV
jgi:hypothetical protein